MRRALVFRLRLPWLTPRGRPGRRCRAYPAGKKDRVFVLDEVERWIKAGFIRRMAEAEAAAAPCASPAFVNRDRPDKPRLVVDLRQVNAHLQEIKFKFEALAEFMSRLAPLDNPIYWDIKDAYHLVFIHPDDRTYLSFTVKGLTYEALAMPFGLSVAPWAWTKIMRPVLYARRESQFQLIGYVDDHGAAAPGRRPVSKRDAAAGSLQVTLLYDRKGLTMRPTKGEREGTQQLTLLGFMIDTAANAARLSDSRVSKLRGAVTATLCGAGRNWRWVGCKAFRSVAGIIVSGSLAIPETRLFASSIYDNQTTGPPDGDCQLSHQSLRDLRYWANFGRHGHGRLIWAAPAARNLHTDASGYEWGGVLDGHTPVRGHFTTETEAWHINVEEVAAIWYSLEGVSLLITKGDRIRVVSDSRVALHVTNELISRSPALCNEVRRLHGQAQSLRVALEAEWILTTESLCAHRLSRSKDSTAWQLDRTFFDSLDSVYGPHSVHRFGTSCNAGLPHYNSPVWDQNLLPDNELNQDWGKGNINWVNPPFKRIPLVLDKIKTDRATATVTLPVWRAHLWWAPVVSAADEVCYLPRRAGLFFRAAAGAQAPRPHWTVCAPRFTHGGRGLPPSLGPEPPRQLATTRLKQGPAARRLPRCYPTNWRTPPKALTLTRGPTSCRSVRRTGTPSSPPRPRSSHVGSASSTSGAP